MYPILYNIADYYKNPTPLFESNGFGFLTECTEFLVTMEQMAHTALARK